MQCSSRLETHSKGDCRQTLRHSFGFTTLALVLILTLAGTRASAETAKPSAQPASQVGSWTTPFNVGVVGIHAALLRTGQVLLWYYPATVGGNPPAVLFNPVTNAVTSVNIPSTSDLFCSGMNIMPDGRVLVTGGLNGIPPSPDYGIASVEIFDPSTSTWTSAAPMNYARWYPTNVELPNGITMIISGSNATATGLVAPLEEYNETTNKWTVLKTTANLPGSVETYPRMFVTTSGNLVMTGTQQTTRLFTPSTNTWSVIGSMLFGNRVYGSYALLPGLQEILAVGGHDSTTSPATNTAEIFNLATNTWTYAGSMANARYNANLELLPDGTLLMVGGNQYEKYASPVEAAELFNPSTGQWTTMASQTARRGYHSSALLLPDGRVLSAGSDDFAKPDYSETVEIFSPPYLSAGARPTITSSPTSVKYGAQFTINTPDASSIKTVALIRAGASTHAENWDQRYVTLSFTAGSGVITATAPSTANSAPPGYYMIALVNTSGVPAVMPFISLTNLGH